VARLELEKGLRAKNRKLTMHLRRKFQKQRRSRLKIFPDEAKPPAPSAPKQEGTASSERNQ